MLLLLAPGAGGSPIAQDALPSRPDSLKFAVIGDTGDGSRAQYEVGQQMVTAHGRFPFELVLMLGDNMYGRQRPEDFAQKFEKPYAGCSRPA
jgi:hypothetical protein